MGFTTQKPGPLQFGWFSHQEPGIWTLQHWLQSNIWVLIASWHNQYPEYAVLSALPPPGFRFAIRPIFVELLSKPWEFGFIFALISEATKRISVRSQIWMLEVKELVKLHMLHIHHVMIWSELYNFIAAYAVGTLKLEQWSSYNPAQNQWLNVTSR